MDDLINRLLADTPDVVALEGFHALKHALRFGAHILGAFTSEPEQNLALARELAPDLVAYMRQQVIVVPGQILARHSPRRIHTDLLAYAARPTWRITDALPTVDRPAILLDDPRHLGNLGAVVRVGAAAGASGLLVRGAADPLDPMAVRGAAGLQYCLPCLGRREILDDLTRQGVVGLDAAAAEFDPTQFNCPVVFAFGSERAGLSDAVRQRCDALVGLPMTPGVSSLNLATSVSAVLYLWRYRRAGQHPADHNEPTGQHSPATGE